LNLGDFVVAGFEFCGDQQDSDELVRNISLSFSDEIELNRNSYWKYSKGNEYWFLVNIPVVRNLSREILNFSFILDFDPKNIQFCSAAIAFDEFREFQHPNLSYPMVMKDFTTSRNLQSGATDLKVFLDRKSEANEKVVIWILTCMDHMDDHLTFNISSRSLNANGFSLQIFPRSLILNGTIQEASTELVLSFTGFDVIVIVPSNDLFNNVIWNVHVYSLNTENSSSTSPKPFPLMTVIYGLLGAIFLVALAVHALKKIRNSSNVDEESGKISFASTILGDDESYTIHSSSTISTIPLH
jgi:hypothetical protein